MIAKTCEKEESDSLRKLNWSSGEAKAIEITIENITSEESANLTLIASIWIVPENTELF